MLTDNDKLRLRRWRNRGFYSERALVTLLKKNGYNAVRIPVSAPSLSPLPDVVARKNNNVFAFEVKNSSYFAYFPKQQIDKLFRFLDEFFPIEKENKYAILAAHLKKKWLFKRVSWKDWENDKILEKMRITRSNRGNFKIEKEIDERL